MKKNIWLIILLAYSSYYSCAMDNTSDIELQPIYKKEQTPNSTTSAEELLETINAAIDKTRSNSTILTSVMPSVFLTPDDMFAICSTVMPHSNNNSVTKEFMNTLYKKNNFFKLAIDYYRNLVLKKLPSITSATLNECMTKKSTIIPETNQFPLILKKYIFKNAFKNIQHSYNIILPIPSIIFSFDIHAATHSAVMGCSDNKIYLWDLKKMKCTHHIGPLEQRVKRILFGPNGLSIIALLKSKNNIKIWDLTSRSLIFNKTTKELIDDITCTQTSSGRLAVQIVTQNQETVKITTYTKKNDTFEKTISTLSATLHPQHNRIVSRDNYSAILNEDSTIPTLTISNNKCPYLYCCQQAVNNSSTVPQFLSILDSKPFARLTDYEQNIIHTAIRKKTTILSNYQKRYKKIAQ